MASVETQLVDVGPRRGETDRAHAGGGRNLIHAPDHREDRGLDVGESQETIIDHEATLEHPVVGDELVQEVSHRRARPRYPAVGLEEAALALARQQGLAVVELKEELDPTAG
jgi:hypothetical protein